MLRVLLVGLGVCILLGQLPAAGFGRTEVDGISMRTIEYLKTKQTAAGPGLQFRITDRGDGSHMVSLGYALQIWPSERGKAYGGRHSASNAEAETASVR